MNLNLAALTSRSDDFTNQVRDITEGLCSGFGSNNASCNKGLPVPFNMAFLAPGTFNIMGCVPQIPQLP